MFKITRPRFLSAGLNVIFLLRCSLRSVVSSRLSRGEKNDRLLLMCVVVDDFRSVMNVESSGSVG